MHILFTSLMAMFITLAMPAPQAHAGGISVSFNSGHHYNRQHHRVRHYHLHHARPRPVTWRSSVFTTHTYVPQYIYVPVKYDGSEYCREYQAGAIIGGKKQRSYGTACLQPDGSWKIIN